MKNKMIVAGVFALISTGLVQAALITGESVHDVSSEYSADYTATNVVNESGLTSSGTDAWTHSVDAAGLTYLSDGTSVAWLEFDLGEVTTLTEIHLWNGNNSAAGKRDRGAKTIDVYVSNTPGTAGDNTADGTWGTKIATISPAMGPGSNDYEGERFDITDTEGRYVRLDITENHGDAYTALNEVHFYAIPEAKTAYELWEEEYGLQEGAEGDDDKDNVSNLAEYAINGNPTNAANTGQTSISNDGSTFTYVHAKHATDNSLVYRLIDTTDLVNGTPGTNGYVSQVDGPVVGDYLMVTNNYDMTGKPVQFVELEVEQY